MGCHYYYLGESGVDKFIRFSEDDETVGCLCTFPYNDGEVLTKERVKSLAILGMAVVLVSDHEMTTPVFLPNGIPKWMLDELDRLLEIDSKE